MAEFIAPVPNSNRCPKTLLASPASLLFLLPLLAFFPTSSLGIIPLNSVRNSENRNRSGLAKDGYSRSGAYSKVPRFKRFRDFRHRYPLRFKDSPWREKYPAMSNPAFWNKRPLPDVDPLMSSASELKPYEGNTWENNWFRLVNFGLNSFVALSTYRSNSTGFAIVCEVRVRASKPSSVFCTWENHNKTEILTVKAALFTGGSSNGRPLEGGVFICNFVQEIGSDDNGGNLYLASSSGMKNYLIHEEEPKAFSRMFNPHEYNLTFCGPPLFGQVQNQIILEWFQYHYRVIGVEHFYLYNYGGLNKDLNQSLLHHGFLPSKSLTVIKNANHRMFNAWYYHQQTNNNDCLYRNRFSAKWTLFTDFDEFVYTAPITTFLSHLNSQPSFLSWFSLGSIPWCYQYCEPEIHGRTFKMERALWRKNGPYCFNSTHSSFFLDRDICPNSRGHRKVVIQPSKNDLLHIHDVKVGGDGIDWNASLFSTYPKIYHFSGIIRHASCRYSVRGVETLKKLGFVKDTSLRDAFVTIFP